jgi:predicted amidophosphoribosyltransferase
LLYRLKYGSDNSVSEEIVSAAAGFMAQWKPGVDLLVPVPPTRSDRAQQPVMVLAAALSAKLGIPLAVQSLTRVKQPPEAKDVFDLNEKLRLLADAYAVDPNQTRGHRILLFDDVYQSGATMNTAASTLYDGGGVAEVYALAITRTRSKS